MKGDLFDLKNVKPMLLTEAEPFDSKDYIYELKLDGIRCVAYLDEFETDLRNKRNKILKNIYPELKLVHKKVNKRCIIDGELVVMTEGKPDFFEVQRRSLMTDRFKIDLLSKQKPVRFVAYDIIYIDDKEISELPLLERKKILNETIHEDESLVISRYIHEKGIEFYHIAANQELEGVVAKKTNSVYQFGKRSKYWIKFKHMLDDDFVLCGYVPSEEEGKIKSLVLGAYLSGQLVYQGHVALGISKDEQRIIIEFAKKNRIASPFPHKESEETIWFTPELVCTVKFMMRTESGYLRQPVFKGLRFDKNKNECTIKQ